MMHKDKGIVLQQSSADQNVLIILTPSGGKIKFFRSETDRKRSFSPGALLSFVAEQGLFKKIKDIEVIALPRVSDAQDLYVLHYFIELAFFYAQPGLTDDRMFSALLKYIALIPYKNMFSPASRLKLIIAFHFLSETGLYNYDDIVKSDRCITLINRLDETVIIDENLHDLAQFVNKLTIHEIKQIEFFIERAMRGHPLFNLFKTLHSTSAEIALGIYNDK